MVLKSIKVYSIPKGVFRDWLVPTKEEALQNNKETYGVQEDSIEGLVEGGIPSLCVLNEIKPG